MADTLITNLPNVPSPTGAEELPVNVPGSPDTDGKVVFSALAAYVKGTIGNATASVAGLATAAQITKLDGIEALADVTDAANVGSTIHGATAKTTPADADTVPLIDSAASNVLKKLSWANIKATLKTYFDALYVTGPSSATDNAIVRFDGTTGKLVQNSGATISDLGVITASALQSTPGSTSGAGAGGDGGSLQMRGGPGQEDGESSESGGSGGHIYTTGGQAYANNSLGYQFAGGNGGNINTSGGSASVGGAGAPGGAINTSDGGGSIDTRTGIIELGPQGSRTTIQANNSGDTSILLPPTEGTAGQFLSTDGAGNWDWSTGGDALTTNPLSQFASTTSDQLRGVVSDGTGTEALVFANSPTLVTPALGTPSSGTLTNCTGLPTAGLVDDAVTLAKMAAGTAGNLITYDASGNPAAVATGTAGQRLTSNGAGAAPTFQSEALRIPIFFSDQTTDWTTGLKVTFTWRFGTTTLSSTPIDCVTAPTGSAAQFDVKKNGTTIYSTKPTIDAGETSTGTAATPAAFSTTSLANGDIVTIHIDQVGSTIKGQGGVLTFVGVTIP
jgi:hypothetical protein